MCTPVESQNKFTTSWGGHLRVEGGDRGPVGKKRK